MTFEELNLVPELKEAIDYMGFTRLTEIQEKTFLPVVQGRDVLGLASTGSGKTLAFCLPLCQLLLTISTPAGVLVISPTRELCIQTARHLQGLTYPTRLHAEAVYGGSDAGAFEREKQAFENRVDIIVATPGRLLAHMRNAYMDLSFYRYLVLDEADKLLDMGFFEDIMLIASKLPDRRQNLLFSATMSPRIRKLADLILREPVEVSLAVAKPASGIDQKVVLIHEDFKIQYLIHLLKSLPSDEQAIVFCGRKKQLTALERKLRNAGLSAGIISSELNQQEREKVMDEFKAKKLRVLIATDVLARGIDISDLSVVVNFDVPPTADDYIHRIGRTARYDRRGSAITLVGPAETGKFYFIEKKLGIAVPKVHPGESFGPHIEWIIPSKPGKKSKKKPIHQPKQTTDPIQPAPSKKPRFKKKPLTKKSGLKDS
ncbi:DEAD/DEAH box helicase [Schleiferia thermophila]